MKTRILRIDLQNYSSTDVIHYADVSSYLRLITPASFGIEFN